MKVETVKVATPKADHPYKVINKEDMKDGDKIYSEKAPRKPRSKKVSK